MTPTSPGSRASSRRFPDAETAVQDIVAHLVGGTEHVGSETPPDLQQRLPFVRVTRYGGGDDGVTDTAEVDVDVYGTRRTPTFKLAEAIREVLLAAPHVLHTPDGPVVCDSVATITGPFQPPGGDDDTVRRFTASYSARFRRAPSTS